MKNGTIVQVTAGRLGGWDNEQCNGRPSEEVVSEGWVGEIIGAVPWDDDGVWFIARFPIADGATLYVPVVEPDHVTIIERSES